MMWYGRMGFTLNSPELTRDALIITGQINTLKSGEVSVARSWADMASAVDFFVGETDDLTAYQYTQVAKKIFGENVSEEKFSDQTLLSKFIATALEELPQPRILSEAILMQDIDSKAKQELLAETMQFRFFGQRFTLDSYIINKLTQGDEKPDPETGQKLPTMPTALMPIYLLNPSNGVVKSYLDKWINDPARIQKQNRVSDKVIAKVLGQLQNEIAGYDKLVWTQNIYWSWLDCFKTLLKKYGAGFPYFMQTEKWQKKNLGAVLGSFSELKHDTLLYAKQSYAELGAGGPDETRKLPAVVKGYVEPDMDFWNKIIILTEKIKDGLKSRNIFPEDFNYKYEKFVEAVKFFRQMAEQELSNKKISDEDFEKLRKIYNSLRIVIDPIANQELTDKEKRAGIIADIHTDVPHEEILYEATGKPYIIYVAVKDINGTRLTRGAVFSHYEFTDSLQERLSDEDWQAKVYNNKALPQADLWLQELIK